ncbi:MAG: cystathionine beta-synthase, partial [Flavobacteriaceae bacterium]|nr:cystathionine beta-synthase [Flavobacteriaceae bacterium]
SGAAMQGVKQLYAEGAFDKDAKVVIIFPDHGSRYMSKVFSDQWMEEQGFFDSKNEATVKTIQYIK